MARTQRNATLVVGVVGIVMSGFIGPSVTAWFTSRREEARDMRTLATARLEDLRQVLDDAAELLSNAVGQLRPLLVAAQEDKPLPKEPADFLSSLAPLGQRMRLRLPDTHPVITDYENAVTRLREVARATAAQSEFDAAVGRFETARDEFLASSRAELRTDIFDSERTMPVAKTPALQLEPAPRSRATADHDAVAGGSDSTAESEEHAESGTPPRFGDPPSSAPPDPPPSSLGGPTSSPGGPISSPGSSSSGGAGRLLPPESPEDARSRPEAGGRAQGDEPPERNGGWMDWDKFTVERAVVHYVPTEKVEDDDGVGAGSGLMLTDAVIELDVSLKVYFRDKIATRLESKGMEVVADPDEQAQVVCDAVGAVLSDPDQLVERSKVIATHLHTIQSKVNSSGLLAVVLGTVGETPCVCLRNLTLTDKTKVYKTALLLQEDTGITGWAADDQRTTATGQQVATFFLARFLGCRPKLPAAQITYEFVKAASASFNEDVQSPKRRGRYQVALLSVMQDNTTTITPRTFAETHREAEDRQPFLGRVEKAAGVTPDTTFGKDTSRVNVSRFRMTFTSGNLVLVGDREALGSTVVIPDDNKPDTPVELRTRVDDVLTGH